MSSLLGVDLGTSSVKVVVSTLEGAIEGIGTAEYPILTPAPDYAEQDPEAWWRGAASAVRQALQEAGKPEVLGIGFSGQMHGFVAVGNEQNRCGQLSSGRINAVRPCCPKSGSESEPTCWPRPVAPPPRPVLDFLTTLVAETRTETLDRTQALLMPKDYLA